MRKPHDTRVFEVSGHRLRVVSLGKHRRPDHPRDHRSSLRGPRAHPVRVAPVGRPAQRVRPSLAGETRCPRRPVAPIARLLGVGQIVARNDLQFERFRIARPYEVMPLLASAQGVGVATTFGPLGINEPSPIAPMRDEADLRDDTGSPVRAGCRVHGGRTADDPSRADARQPVIVAGDGEGLLSLASAGLLDGSELLQYSAIVRRRHVGTHPPDRSRRRARGHRHDRRQGASVERPARQPRLHRSRPASNRCAKTSPTTVSTSSPTQRDDAFNRVTQYPGGVSARATSYGNPNSYTPEYRAANAIDGDLVHRGAPVHRATCARRGTPPRLRRPVTTDHLTVTQLLSGVRNRTITDLDLRFDERDIVPVRLDAISNTPAGQDTHLSRSERSTPSNSSSGATTPVVSRSSDGRCATRPHRSRLLRGRRRLADTATNSCACPPTC